MIIQSAYNAPFGFSNGHIQSIFPTLFRHIAPFFYTRERISTPDDDFLDLDWLKTRSKKCIILSHGLEGNSHRCYVTGMAKYFGENGFDSCAWNFRGCSGEINKNLRMYHSGATDDLDLVVHHVAKLYDEIHLIGFSMGGNLSLKYLGEQHSSVHENVKSCVAFSVPSDLKESCDELEKKSNSIYMKRFLRKLREKVLTKEIQFPDNISSGNYSKISTFEQFDDRYTAPLHGFSSAKDYYEKSSSKQFIPSIKIPTLMVSAKNDPFLSESCYPISECEHHKYVNLEIPESGGHIGFVQHGGIYWSEKRALEFILSHKR